jgi:Tfp pilus assembly protein PilF
VDAFGAEPRPAEQDNLPAGLRLTRSSDHYGPKHRGVSGWLAGAIAVAGVLLGWLLAYSLQPAGPVIRRLPDGTLNPNRGGPVIPLAAAEMADVDAAFEATKQGRFSDARLRFTALAEKHPGWASMRIEAARSTMYEHDFDKASGIVASIARTADNADAEFLNGLLNMTTEVYDKAEEGFARAIALDPARPDIFYFWGECLRREGKPREAAVKFHEALMRNQYETSEGLFTLKLWLSEIQANDETTQEVNTAIDNDLASGHPSGPALFAAAARDLKAGRAAEAGQHIAAAQKVMEPAVFRVILQDPTFLQEGYRPELAPFYQQ